MAVDIQSGSGGWAYINETLHCDGMPLEGLREHLRQEFGHAASPAFVYSYSTLVANAQSYVSALATLGSRGVLSYSLKANSNPALLKVLREAGVSMATCVSGNEIQMALRVGFPAHLIIMNGNGKRWWEVELAVRSGCLLNVDSLFDAHRIISVARTVREKARILLRLNPHDVDSETHPYLATAHVHSKFGVEESQVEQVLEVLYEARDSVKLEGVHIHVGSGITRIMVYADLMTAALSTLEQIRKSGWSAASTVNLGGGLNVSYAPPSNSSHTNPTTSVKNSNASTSETRRTDNDDDEDGDGDSVEDDAALLSPGKLVEVLLPLIPDDITLILEPGRSIMATAGVLLTEVLGVKSSGGKQFVVVDSAMTEVIRPALYGGHHALTPLTTQGFGAEGKMNGTGEEESTAGVEVDVVGPVCESSDVLARGCVLPCLPAPGVALVIWTVGAYCFSMASNYNLRPHAIEVLVHGTGRYTVVRRPQQFLEVIGNCV